MAPVAVPAAPQHIVSLKESVVTSTVSAESKVEGAHLVIGSPATAHDGTYQAAIVSAGEVEKQMADRILDEGEYTGPVARFPPMGLMPFY